MFERYTEKARRTIFFSRYEASTAGSQYIKSEHLLLGLIRESKTILNTYLGERVSETELRSQVTAHSVFAATATSVDLPFSEECRHILSYSAEEAMQLGHEHIGTEHLLLGMLREESCLGARLLSKYGLALEQARAILSSTEAPIPSQERGPSGIGPGRYGSGSVQANIARRFRSSEGAPFSVRFVDAESSESLFAISSASLIPRVGESIVLHRSDGTLHAYRVQDVVWTFLEQSDATRAQQVAVKVARESAKDS